MSRRNDEENVSIEVEKVKVETDKAILVIVEDEEVWVPKSQIHEDSEVYSLKSGKDGGTLVVTQWFGQKAGWT